MATVKDIKMSYTYNFTFKINIHKYIFQIVIKYSDTMV